MKIASDKFWNDLQLKVLRKMTVDIEPTITPISHPLTSDAGELIGTGTFVTFCGQSYVLTNEHVARLQPDGGLGYLPKKGEFYHRIRNPFQAVSQPTDAAIARLDQDSFAQGDRVCVSARQIAERFDAPERDLLFVFGFPGVLSRMSALAGGLLTRSIPYLTQQAPLPADYDSAISFALLYPANEVLQTTNGKPGILPDPHGMSGSGVWATGVVKRSGKVGKLRAPRIVGIVHSWDLNNQVLIATKIEFIRKFIVDALRKECAYFSWLQRGQPLNDDWQDWLVAEKSIPFLR